MEWSWESLLFSGKKRLVHWDGGWDCRGQVANTWSRWMVYFCSSGGILVFLAEKAIVVGTLATERISWQPCLGSVQRPDSN